MFSKRTLELYIGFAKHKITSNITQMLNPTINMNAGDVAKIPIVINNEKEAPVDFLVKAMILCRRQIGIPMKTHGISSVIRWCEVRYGRGALNESFCRPTSHLF